MGPLWKKFGPEDLAPELVPRSIGGTVVVQAAPTEAECDYLLDIAQQTPWILGVVGWVDLESPRAVQRLKHYSKQAKFRGVRPMLQDLAAADWIARPTLDTALDALASLELTFDALIRLPHIAHIATIAARHPRLTIVIDHAAKPSIGSGSLEAWRIGIESLAAFPNVVCKLSGLVNEAAPDAPANAFRELVQILLDAFGPDRLLWGSDWPVLTSQSSYGIWWDITADLLGGLDASARDQVMGLNSQRVYKLTTP
jgi:L-fuconolactonase